MRRAFTLIELLIVISIIALLIAILLPVLKNARKSAIDVTCASNLHQIGIAYADYGIANDGYYPKGINPGKWAFGHVEDDAGPSPRGGETVLNGLGALWQSGLLATPDVLYCPYETYFTKDKFWRVGTNPSNTYTGYMSLVRYNTNYYPLSVEQCAQEQTSPAETFLAADISVKLTANKDPYKWYSHRLNDEGLGGFTLYNDGSTIYRDDTQLIYRFTISSRAFYW